MTLTSDILEAPVSRVLLETFLSGTPEDVNNKYATQLDNKIIHEQKWHDTLTLTWTKATVTTMIMACKHTRPG